MKTSASFVVIILVVMIFSIIALRMIFGSFRSNDPMIQKVRDNFAKLNPEYRNIYVTDGSGSYTVNQKYITLCVRDPNTGEYYNENVIMYVALHELAHVLAEEEDEDYGLHDTPYFDKDHGPNFGRTFKSLLRQAISRGIYDPRYKVPRNYCGGKYD